jgi:hypothetical protein
MGLLTRDTRRQLIEALTAVPVLDSSAGRGLLLHDLPPRLTVMLARSESKLLDLNAIVDGCDHWEPISGVPHPLRLLIENARDLVMGSAVAIRLQALLDTFPTEDAPPAIGPAPAPTPGPPPVDTAAEDRGSAALRAAFAPFLAELDEIGNPELLTKARELRSALQQAEPDVEQITELRRWFSSRPGHARAAAAAFFGTPIVRRLIADATAREFAGWETRNEGRGMRNEE